MTRQQQQLILRLWQEWCRVWPEQYGHESLRVKPEGYDPVFDVVPSQTYKDFYFEVVRGHPKLRSLDAFEVVDTALNQIRAPEMTLRSAAPKDSIEDDTPASEIAVPEAVVQHIEPRVVEVELKTVTGNVESFDDIQNTGTKGR
ncbi:MAG: hypothetical protein GKR90_14425 [Pseudomonadales bacterium]|nr:hypothetical protein [Pseudomonadales bacterium]